MTDDQPTPSYEAARDELTDVVRQLEQGGATLEESLGLWERGEQLAQVCQSWLDGAKARLDAALADQSPSGQSPSGQSPSGQRPSVQGQSAQRPDQQL